MRLQEAAVQYRPLGMTGLTVSELGFGCGAVGGLMTQGEPEEQRTAIARALEAGVTYFDTAQQYGNGRSEENLGRALERPGRLGPRRRRHEAAAPPRGLCATRRQRAAELLQVSLRRLGRDSIDLIQQHGQVDDEADSDSPTAREMTEIVADALDVAARCRPRAPLSASPASATRGAAYGGRLRALRDGAELLQRREPQRRIPGRQQRRRRFRRSD